jgi:hypothetical protein
VGLKIIGDYQNSTLGDTFSSENVGQPRSSYKYNKDNVPGSISIPTREHSLTRGRSGHRLGHPVQLAPHVFGVDDLSLPMPSTGLSATRPAKTRNLSPVSVREYRRSRSRTDTIPAEESSSPPNPRRNLKS